MRCCLVACALGPLDSNQARVEVKSALPKGDINKFKNKFAVSWKKNGEAVFHKACWDKLLLASRCRKRKQPGEGPSETSNGEVTVQTRVEKEMIRSASETAEMFDSNESVRSAALQIVSMIKASKHCMIFTGAGISTSAGLGDFRGKGGKWTEQDREAILIEAPVTEEESNQEEKALTQKKRLKLPYNASKENSNTTSSSSSSEVTSEKDEEEEEVEEIAYEALRPTYTHEAIQHLVQEGYVKYLVSQNCDGLHLLSGVPPSKISELHGNVFVEYCEKCKERYQRSYYVLDDIADVYLEEVEDNGKSDVIPPPFMRKCRKCGLSHRTGRRCEKKGCKGHLVDTIINFRDNLEKEILDRAFDSAESCDLLICLGTTLTVTPASSIVDLIKRPPRVVICNRQATERDASCLRKDKSGSQLGVRVYADCDSLMRHLMACLLGDNLDQFETTAQAKRVQYDAQRSMT